MRTISIIGIIILMITALLATAKFYPSIFQRETIEISVLRDQTDTLKAMPDSKSIISAFDLEDNPWHGAIFRITDLTDVSMSESATAKLSPAYQILSNEFDRKKEVENFKTTVKEAIESSGTPGKSYSSVYIPIARELNLLHESTATQKSLVIYSDLLENEKDFSLYRSETINMLTESPDEILKYLETKMSIPILSGISIYLVYQPQNPETDKMFLQVSSFYKTWFEAKGAVVHIVPDFIL